MPRTGEGDGLSTNHVRDLLASLLALAWFVEAKDPYTGGHLWRVSRYARLLAEAAGWSAEESARAGLGGFLHDLGKVGIADAILRKPARLTEAEQAVMRTHPVVGHRMLAGHPLGGWVHDAVLFHHERPDGRGYPRGLSGEAVAPVARVIAIADTFDAMTSHRAFRPAQGREETLAEMRGLAGTQLDAELTGRFVALGEAGHLDHVVGHSDDGIPLQSCPLCGPTLVIRREAAAGDRAHCPNCGGGFQLEQAGDTLRAAPTGRPGSAIDLAPEADEALISRTVREAVDAILPVSAPAPVPPRGSP